jgi:hypothetical protein
MFPSAGNVSETDESNRFAMGWNEIYSPQFLPVKPGILGSNRAQSSVTVFGVCCGVCCGCHEVADGIKLVAARATVFTAPEQVMSAVFADEATVAKASLRMPIRFHRVITDRQIVIPECAGGRNHSDRTGKQDIKSKRLMWHRHLILRGRPDAR